MCVCVGKKKFGDGEMMQSNKSGNEKIFQINIKVLVFNYQEKMESPKDRWNYKVCIMESLSVLP